MRKHWPGFRWNFWPALAWNSWLGLPRNNWRDLIWSFWQVFRRNKADDLLNFIYLTGRVCRGTFGRGCGRNGRVSAVYPVCQRITAPYTYICFSVVERPPPAGFSATDISATFLFYSCLCTKKLHTKNTYICCQNDKNNEVVGANNQRTHGCLIEVSLN
jgi:hypothetical protein